VNVRINLLPHREERRKRGRQHFAVLAGLTATLGAVVGTGGLGRYLVDGLAQRKYEEVFAGGLLVALLAITVAVSYAQFGRLNAVVALAIAAIKATLIVLFFMHLRSSAKLIWIVTAASVVWLAIMFALTVSDYETRRFLPAPAVWQK